MADRNKIGTINAAYYAINGKDLPELQNAASFGGIANKLTSLGETGQQAIIDKWYNNPTGASDTAFARLVKAAEANQWDPTDPNRKADFIKMQQNFTAEEIAKETDTPVAPSAPSTPTTDTVGMDTPAIVTPPTAVTPTVTPTPTTTTDTYTMPSSSGLDMNELMKQRLSATGDTVKTVTPELLASYMPTVNAMYAPQEQRAREAVKQSLSSSGRLMGGKGVEGVGGQAQQQFETLEAENVATKTKAGLDLAQKIVDTQNTVSQDAYDKAFQTSERLGTQSFATSERVETEIWQSNEEQANRDYQTYVTKAKTGYIDTDGKFHYGTDAALSKIQNDWARANLELQGAINAKNTESEYALKKEIAAMEKEYEKQLTDLKGENDQISAGIAGLATVAGVII
jgi:hypothetical protein